MNMAKVPAFHTSTDEDGDPLRHHDESECGYGKEIIRNGHYVAGILPGSILCDRCRDLAKGL